MKRWLAAAAAVLAIPACATPPAPGKVKPVFEDVPAPEGLTYDAGLAHMSPTGEFRTATQEYSGMRRLDDVVRFYKDVLPQHAWSLVSEEGTDPHTLKFEKRSEALTITVDGRGPKLAVKLAIGLKK